MYIIHAVVKDIHNNAIIFDLHIDPLLQSVLFDYRIDEMHEPDWMPGAWQNQWAWRLLRDVMR